MFFSEWTFILRPHSVCILVRAACGLRATSRPTAAPLWSAVGAVVGRESGVDPSGSAVEAPPASSEARVCASRVFGFGWSRAASRSRCSTYAGAVRTPVRSVLGYLVDPASSHMLVSKIKPCMSKYKRLVL